MNITDEKIFFDTIRVTLFGGRLSRVQVDRVQALLIEMQRVELVTPERGAYILATAHWETDRFNAMEEYASGEAYEGRSDLGNVKPGDGKRYKGRGFPMLTGRRNYQMASEMTGRDLIENPALASDPDLSAMVIVLGMMGGLFTKRSLAAFINDGKTDFIQARKVVNGLDRAEVVADLAERYLQAITLAISASPRTNIAKPVLSRAGAESDGQFSVPARRAPRFAQSVACGSSITAMWTAIAASGLLPEPIAEPEITVAIGGVLSALASAFGLCNFFRPVARRPVDEEV